LHDWNEISKITTALLKCSFHGLHRCEAYVVKVLVHELLLETKVGKRVAHSQRDKQSHVSILTMDSNKIGTVREENENQQCRSSWSQAASFPRIAVTSSSTLKKTGRLCLWQKIGT
jgi:hypothetical protein